MIVSPRADGPSTEANQSTFEQEQLDSFRSYDDR
jgi:hypothetical protein